MKVSFLRGTAGNYADYGMKWQRWELPFLKWLDRQGIAVDLCTESDLELVPGPAERLRRPSAGMAELAGVVSLSAGVELHRPDPTPQLCLMTAYMSRSATSTTTLAICDERR